MSEKGIIAIIITLVIVVVGLSALSKPKRSAYEDAIVERAVDNLDKVELSDNPTMKEAFISSCEIEGNPEYCECTWKYLRRTKTPTQISKMGLDMLDGEPLPDLFWSAINFCIDKY